MPTDPSDHPFASRHEVESVVERQIREAQERGEFDDLPGSGRPLRSAGSYDPDWWARQYVKRERLRDQADDLRRTIRSEAPRLLAAGDAEARRRIDEINAEVERLNEMLPGTDRIEPITQ
jgi:hypothetical protein